MPAPLAPVTPPSQAMAPMEPSLDLAQSAAVGGESVALADSAVGYIDPAIPRNRFRLRFDNANFNNRPDRAEFFYAKCGCFRTAPAPFTDPNAPGPPLPEKSVDYQDLRGYIELAATDRMSAFVEVPYRWLNPEINDNTSGIGDMDAGIKVALVADCNRVVSFQFRTYIPTGDADRGLGVDHVSLEPAILVYQQLSDRLFFEGEVRDWIPIDGTDFAGNIIRWGGGLTYNFASCPERRLLGPVGEIVGWNVLGGKSSDFFGNVQDAGGDMIVNAKLGVRASIGDNNSIYAGYGRALTGEVWYKEIWRFEYRIAY
jgi:hypothetical protein